MGWMLVVLVVIVFVALFFYLRKRRVEQREAEDARAQAFLMEMQRTRVTNEVAPEADSVAASGRVDVSEPQSSGGGARIHEATTSIEEDVAQPTPGSGRGYLNRTHQIVWRWLRAGLPEHEIFARGSLRRVVGRDRIEKDMRLDFVVCNADFEVLAAIDLGREGSHDMSSRDLSGHDVSRATKRDALAAVGVRYACWDASHLPDKAFLVRWVNGEAEIGR